MSEEEKIEFASAEACPPGEEPAGAVPVRKGKRRNGMVVPGSSDPLVAKLYSDHLMEQVFAPKQEADKSNPENASSP
jgi:hypothetical protein